jgi:protein-S-isoprenylcysteine O-methyltransferase Ste14
MRPLPFSEPLYGWIFLSVYMFWGTLETIWSFTKRARDRSKTKDRGSFPLLLVFLYTALGLDFCFAFVLPQAAITWKRELVFFVGIGLMLAGIAFRYYAIATLGRFFTFNVAVHTGQTVIQSGPYRYIRHPSYTGALLTLIGVGLVLGNWAGLIALVGLMGCAYGYRMHVEEAALVEALGEPYSEYRRRTKRLVPYLF